VGLITTAALVEMRRTTDQIVSTRLCQDLVRGTEMSLKSPNILFKLRAIYRDVSIVD
jgi:hypothetical protein